VQSEHELAVKAAREELSAKLVDEFHDRDVTVLPATLNIMTLQELMAALVVEVRCSTFFRVYARTRLQDNHKKVLEVLLAKPEFIGDDAAVSKLEAISANQRTLTEAIDALMPAVMQSEVSVCARWWRVHGSGRDQATRARGSGRGWQHFGGAQIRAQILCHCLVSFDVLFIRILATMTPILVAFETRHNFLCRK
jgi:hypothetical protein